MAALTIPTILHNIQQVVLNNQFKKTYSMLKQAIFAIQAEHGMPVKCYFWQDGAKPFICTVTCSENEKDEYGNCTKYYCAETGKPMPSNNNGEYSECEYFDNELFFNKLKVIKYCNDNALANGCIPEEYSGVDQYYLENDPEAKVNPNGLMGTNSIKNSYPAFVLVDGTIIVRGIGLGKVPIYMFDINGFSGPNKLGYDIYSVVPEGNKIDGIVGFRKQQDVSAKGGLNFDERLEAIGLR